MTHAFILLLSFAAISFGAESIVPVRTLPEIVIQAKVLGAKQVFTRESVQKSGARNAAEFLDLVAGISMREDAASGGKVYARIGGANSNQVAVLVDGLKISEVGSGESDLSEISTDEIESIEVVRGGGGAISESIGGAILIHTKTPDGDGLRLHAETSETKSTLRASRDWSSNNFGASIDASRESGNGDYRFRVTEQDGNGPFTIHLGEIFRRENNHLTRDRVAGKLSKNLGAHQIIGSFGAERASFGLPGYLAPRPTPEANQNELSRLLQAQWSMQGNRFNSTTVLGYQNQSKEFRDDDPFSFLHESHESSERITAVSQVTRDLKVVSGSFEGRIERESLSSGVLDNNGATRTRWRTTTSWSRSFALSSDHRRQIDLTGNFAAERFGDSPVQTLPGVEALFANNTNLSFQLGAKFAKAYRAPSFYSLFWNDELLAQGNPDLRPETSTLTEVYTRVSTTNNCATTLEVDASHNSVSDLIYWRQAFDGRWTPQNLRRATLDNLTVSITQAVIPSHLNAECSMEWLEARDRSGERVTDGKYLIYRAPQTFNARLSGEIWNMTAKLQGQWVDRQAVLETNSKWLSAYSLIDAEISHGFTWGGAHWNAAFRCENLLNEDYRIVRFAPMPLREYSISLTCDFGRTNE
jgi:vitamin B12 transporter